MDLEAGAGAGAGAGALVPLLLEAELDTFSVWGRELRAGWGGACRWVMLQSTGEVIIKIKSPLQLKKKI